MQSAIFETNNVGDFPGVVGCPANARSLFYSH